MKVHRRNPHRHHRRTLHKLRPIRNTTVPTMGKVIIPITTEVISTIARTAMDTTIISGNSMAPHTADTDNGMRVLVDMAAVDITDPLSWPILHILFLYH